MPVVKRAMQLREWEKKLWYSHSTWIALVFWHAIQVLVAQQKDNL